MMLHVISAAIKFVVIQSKFKVVFFCWGGGGIDNFSCVTFCFNFKGTDISFIIICNFVFMGTFKNTILNYGSNVFIILFCYLFLLTFISSVTCSHAHPSVGFFFLARISAVNFQEDTNERFELLIITTVKELS